EGEDVRAALEAGAVAAVAGTRFLLSDESRAHPDYKQRCLDADETLLTELFGLGWPDAPHRVIPNAATQQWLTGDSRGPGWIRMADPLYSSPLAEALAPDVLDRFKRYVRFDTQSRRDRERSPSTPGQLELGRVLVSELHEIGLRDAELDDNGYVMATLASSDG